MKSSKVEPLDFSCSYPEMIELSIQKEAYLRRDQVVLLPRGITVKKLDDFAAERTALIAMSPYVIDNREHTLALQACEAKRSTLAAGLIEVQDIAFNTYTKNGTKYFPFKLLGINKLSAAQLIDKVPVFVKNGTNDLAEMGVQGLTAVMLTDLTTMATDLTSLLEVPPVIDSNTSSATIARHISENKHFNNMRTMSQTGHIFFKTTDKVKAKDYVMDSSIPKVTNRKGIVKSNSATTRKAANLVARSRIRVKVSTGTSVEMYFGMTKSTMPTDKALTIKKNENIFATTTAAALGYDLAGGIIHLIIRNPNDDDAKFLVKIG